MLTVSHSAFVFAATSTSVFFNLLLALSILFFFLVLAIFLPFVLSASAFFFRSRTELSSTAACPCSTSIHPLVSLT